MKKDDEVLAWAERWPKMFVPLDSAIQLRAAEIINRFPSLTDPSRTRGRADPFVIALAQERGLSVVTVETSKPTKPRIPDVCQQLGIDCIDLVTLFRLEGWRL